MKKRIKRLFFRDNGSVSIFAIMIILPIFVLNGLLIDTVRIMTANRQIENATESALRSVMSQFDPDLAAVGLFGYAGGDAEGDFKKYVGKQFLSADRTSGIYNLVNPKINKSSLTVRLPADRDLIDFDVFGHQILESMKYQAPVQFGKDLIGLFKGGKGASQEDLDKAEKLVEEYGEIIKLMKKRNKKIDEAKGLLDKYIKILDDIQNDVIGKKVSGKKDKIPDGIKKYNEMIGYFDRYMELVKKDKDEDKELTKEEKKEKKEYEKGKTFDVEDEVKSLANAVIYSDEIKNLLVGSAGTAENPVPKTAADYNKKVNEFFEGDAELLEDLKEFTLDQKFFKDIDENVAEIRKQLLEGEEVPQNLWNETNLKNQSIKSLYLSFRGTINLAINKASLEVPKYIVDSMETRIKTLKEDYKKKVKNTHLKKYDALKKKLENTKTNKEEDATKESFGTLWKKLNGILEYTDLPGEQAIYDELEGYVKEYNGTVDGADTDEPKWLQFVKDSFKRFKEFVEFVQGFPASVRNEIYINEYILANYGTQGGYGFEEGSNFSYETKKGQYITYGYAKPAVNYFMFLKDITMILLITNLLEQGIQGGFLGPAGFFKTIGMSILETTRNMEQLLNKGEFFWTPFAKLSKGGKGVNMDMKMFLRMFLLMKSTNKTYNQEKMRRLQAAITEDTDVKLNDRATYIEGTVEAKIKLLFIPALTKLIQDKGRKSPPGYYTIRKKKIFSY